MELDDPICDEGAAAAVARALAHPARVRIVCLLLSRPGCFGGDIVAELGLAQSTVSEHLRILREAGIVAGEAAHPRVCHRLVPEALAPLGRLLDAVADRAEAGTLTGSICLDTDTPGAGR